MGLRSALGRVGPLGTALTLGQLGLVVHRHWGTIPLEHRARLRELLRKSKGKPSNLSHAERHELRELVHRLELSRLARSGARGALGLRRRLGS
jgi:hypothetical protein